MIFNFKCFAYSFFSLFVHSLWGTFQIYMLAIVCAKQVTCRSAGLSAFLCGFFFVSDLVLCFIYATHIEANVFFCTCFLYVQQNNITKLSTNLRFYYDYYHFPEFCIGLFNVHLTFNFPKVERISLV